MSVSIDKTFILGQLLNRCKNIYTAAWLCDGTHIRIAVPGQHWATITLRLPSNTVNTFMVWAKLTRQRASSVRRGLARHAVSQFKTFES